MATDKGILSDIRVIEVATYVLGPAAATAMSDFGAEVIKVERPSVGDPYRYLSFIPQMPKAEMNYCWLLDGRNKKSVALDLSKQVGREILLKLIARADVLITNYQPSVLRKLRLTYEDLAPLNDRLIYASATGYGEQGDDVEEPGFDMTAYWARSGLMDAVHNADAEPTLSVAGMGDHPSSMTLFGGIMLALYQRERTGRGTKVSTSLMANGAWANGCLIQAALCDAMPYDQPTRVAPINPLVNHFVTRDGKRFIFCLIQPDRDWSSLCRAIGHPELIADPRFATSAARVESGRELVAIIDAAIAEKELAEWKGIFAEHDLVWGPVSTIEEAASDAQMAANEVYIEFDHPRHGRLRTVNSPLFVEGARKLTPQPAPEIGQHTREVLQMLRYSKDEIEELLERGVAASVG
jgi:formyl-CoA transferase